MCLAFNASFLKSLIFSHWVGVDVAFKKIQKKIRRIKKIFRQKRLKWKGKKQWTKVNLGCLLDQVIGKEDNIFHL